MGIEFNSYEADRLIKESNRKIARMAVPIDFMLANEETDLQMPHRRLVKIGETPALPTISQFLTEMATRQHEEIVRLKREAAEGLLPNPTVPEEDHENLTPDAWQLHPVRVKEAPRKKVPPKASAKKSAAKKKSAIAKTRRQAKAKTPARKLAAKKK